MTTTTPTKATRPHTRIASATYFDHIFALFESGLTSSIILGLQNKLGTAVTLMDFIYLPQDEISLLEYKNGEEIILGLTRSEIRLEKSIQNWVKYEIAKEKNINFEYLSMDDFDELLLSHAFGSPTTPVPSPTPVQSSAIPPAPVTSVPSAIPYQPTQIPVPAQTPAQMTLGFNPMVYMHPSPAPSVSPFMINVKLDAKRYPVFNGEKMQHSPSLGEESHL